MRKECRSEIDSSTLMTKIAWSDWSGLRRGFLSDLCSYSCSYSRVVPAEGPLHVRNSETCAFPSEGEENTNGTSISIVDDMIVVDQKIHVCHPCPPFSQMVSEPVQ